MFEEYNIEFKVNRIDIVLKPLLLPVLLIFFLIGQIYTYIIVLVCAALHEISHVIVAKIFKVKVEAIEILPIGLACKIDRYKNLSLIKKIALYISGPMINVVLAICAVLLKGRFEYINNEASETFIIVNVSLACLNLLPIMPLDGGQILKALLRYQVKLLELSKICIIISKTMSLIILIPGMVIFGLSGNFSICMVCIFTIFYIFQYRDLISAESIMDFLDKKKSFRLKKTIKTKIIAAFDTISLFELIKQFNLSNFYIVVILDNQFRIISMVNEIEIINYMIKRNTSAKLGDLVNTS